MRKQVRLVTLRLGPSDSHDEWDPFKPHSVHWEIRYRSESIKTSISSHLPLSILHSFVDSPFHVTAPDS